MAKAELPQSRDLHPVLWLALPVLSTVLSVSAPIITDNYGHWRKLMRQETGFLEIATVVFLLPAVVLGIALFIRRRELPRGVGIVMLLAMEMSLSTPPFGLLLFLMLGVAPPGTTLSRVALAAMPFLACDGVLLGLLILLPGLALWLPGLLGV